MVVNVASVDDLRSSLKCSIEAYSVEMIQKAIKKEQEGYNRKTILGLLDRALKAKQAGKKHI